MSGAGGDSHDAAPRSLAQRLLHRAELWWRVATGSREDDASLGREAGRFWNDIGSERRKTEAHWRGQGVFADDAVWQGLGRSHIELLHGVLRQQGIETTARRVVEWGCGGGMNAVHFGRGASRYYGVDIAEPTLAECARQMERAGLAGTFVPLLADPNQPRAALAAIDAPCDLFVCTYLIELLPTEAHALELLDIARDVLKPGGVALIQIRRAEGGVGSRSRPWAYARNMAHNVTFTKPAFAQACRERAFEVLQVVDQDEVRALGERGYACFVLRAGERAAT